MNYKIARGIKYRINVAGGIEYATPEDKEIAETRDRWCICTDDGDVIGISETRKGFVPPESVLLDYLGDTRGNLNCYRISFIEHDMVAKKMVSATKNSSPSSLELGIVGKPYIAFKDIEFIKGNRLREAEIRDNRLKRRRGASWEIVE